MAPKFALVRPLGGEQKLIAEVEDLFVLSNYELTKFAPKHSKAFSMTQLYGWKKPDGTGVYQITKCKIILLRDSQKLIEDDIKNGKVPRCEPSRFESTLKITEDFSLFELLKEKSTVKSKSKSSSTVKASNKSLSEAYIGPKPSTSSSANCAEQSSKQECDDTTQTKQGSDENALNCDANQTKPKSGEFSETVITAKNNNKKESNEKKPRKEERKRKHIKSADNLSDVINPKEGACKKSKIDEDIPLDTMVPNNGMNDVSTNQVLSSSNGKSEIYPPENNSWINSRVPDDQPPNIERREKTCCSSTCCSANIQEMSKILKTLADEVEKLKEMNQTLTAALKDFMDKNVSALAQVLPISNINTELMVDLGGSKPVNREWAEQVVSTSNEPLKWKLSKILHKIFESTELLHYWFDKNRVHESTGDMVFPEECITLLEEFCNEANLKRAKMEIVKRQSKLRKLMTDEELCQKKCEEVHAEIMLQVEPVTNAEVRKQVGKVLYDCKTAHRKSTNTDLKKKPSCNEHKNNGEDSS